MSALEAKPRKILVIDDEPDVVRYLETLLQDNGYETLSAADGKQGFEKAKAEHPDLICLDITMPEKSGVRFYRELREDRELGDVPVVVVTAVTGFGGDPASFEQFLGSRPRLPAPDAFVAKPIDRDEFLSTVSRLLPG
jgi:CheY-like chemotaxis protein